MTGRAAQPGMSFPRANNPPAMPSAIQPTTSAARKPPGNWIIGLILALAFPATSRAGDPPPNLARLVAKRETETQAERNRYLYRQSVTVEELTDRGSLRGDYKEVREVIFSPQGER